MAEGGPHIAAQVVGAFAGAALVYAVYRRAIDAFNAASNTARDAAGGFASFSIFATSPAPYYGGDNPGPLLDQIAGTAFLLIFVVAVIDLRNTAVKANLGPFMIGLAVAAIGMSFGANAGYAINPARDVGPRLFTWLAGWAPSTARSAGISGSRSSGRSSAASSTSSSTTSSSATSARARARAGTAVEPARTHGGPDVAPTPADEE